MAVPHGKHQNLFATACNPYLIGKYTTKYFNAFCNVFHVFHVELKLVPLMAQVAQIMCEDSKYAVRFHLLRLCASQLVILTINATNRICIFYGGRILLNGQYITAADNIGEIFCIHNVVSPYCG